MSTAQYQLFHERIGQAINQCIDACPIGTKTVSEINNATVEDLVRSTIGPLASAENILNINLMDDKPDWRKQGTELAFRKVLLDLVVIIINVLFFLFNNSFKFSGINFL